MKLNSVKVVVLILSIVVLLSCENKKREEPEKLNNPQGNRSQNVLPPDKPVNITRQSNIDKEIADKILAVVYENLDATNKEDVDRVMSTVHPDSPQRNSTIQGMEYVFNIYDLEFTLEDAEVIELNGENAKVHYTLFKKALNGQGFPNSKVEGIHELKKHNGEWKIFRTEEISATQIR